MDAEKELRERIVKLETLVGDADNGLLAEVKQMRAAIEGLKTFQVKVIGAFAALAFVAELLFKVFFK